MPSEISGAAAQVTRALQTAGAATGAGFEFLQRVARRESSLDPDAKAETSSAAGLFQFIEQTWLGAVKAYGARHGLGGFAADIARAPDGRFIVADGARRRDILNLRFDAAASAALAGELANENRSILERRLGRAAGAADLYAAHFLGPAGAVKLLSADARANAAAILPEAARANRAVFYDGARAKAVGEVIASIAASMGEAAPPSADAPFTASDASARAVESASPRRRSPTAPAFALGAVSPRLAWLAFSALHALDPTRLGGGRDDRDGGKSNSEDF